MTILNFSSTLGSYLTGELLESIFLCSSDAWRYSVDNKDRRGEGWEEIGRINGTTSRIK